MIIFYSLIALFAAWIWVDYYRLIDLYEREKFKYLLLTFILGCTSVLIVTGINKYLLDPFAFELNGSFFNDLLYSIFKIGMVEELAKSIPFIIVYYMFRAQINEPVDYVVYLSVSALGFSAVENVMYFDWKGPELINGRSILATVGHMFDTSLIAYGIIRYKYYHKKNGFAYIALFFFLAAFSHGFYDFWLIYEGSSSWGVLITILYFLFTISIFAGILNNALNNSSFFSYKKVINSGKVSGRLLMYYGIIFMLQLLLLIYMRDFAYAIANFKASLYICGFIVVVSVVRLSRFKLIQHHWETLRLELPFSFSPNDTAGTKRGFRIKGDSYNEAYINIFYEEFFTLNPLSSRQTYIEYARAAFIERKIFLKNHETFYVARVYSGDINGPHELMLLKPKASGNSIAYGKYPLAALLKPGNPDDITDKLKSSADFEFMEWVYLKPAEQVMS